MRDYLRRTCDYIWVIDCSPEGHQPDVNTRLFQDVQQPVCIVLASRSAANKPETPAQVRFQALPPGHRAKKFAALSKLTIGGSAWVDCPTDWRAPFLPASTGAWAGYPALEDFFSYNGSGVQAKRTWVIAPDARSLVERWKTLVEAPVDQKELLFHATLRNEKPADRHIRSVVNEGLPGFPAGTSPLIAETGACPPPLGYGFRSFNRQWIIPDARVITQPNAALWESLSDQQIFVTAPSDRSPSGGPALTFSALVPDLHHYNGRGGRAFPLWRDSNASVSNVRPKLSEFLAQKYAAGVSPGDMVAYIAAVAAHPTFTARFQPDLSTPGLRIPLTADLATFREAVALGRTVIWLHTFGERMSDPQAGRSGGPPRLDAAVRPWIPVDGAISQDPSAMPDSLGYDAGKNRLLVGGGFVENVTPRMWNYEVSGKQVLRQWFSYRKANRERPIIGDRRTPSPLGDIQPDHWLSEYTTELHNVLNVLGWLVDLEPAQAALLEKICAGPLISSGDLRQAGALEVPVPPKRRTRPPAGPTLFGDGEV